MSTSKNANNAIQQLNRVDDDYDSKMLGFEIGCQEGTGDPSACHHVGE